MKGKGIGKRGKGRKEDCRTLSRPPRAPVCNHPTKPLRAHLDPFSRVWRDCGATDSLPDPRADALATRKGNRGGVFAPSQLSLARTNPPVYAAWPSFLVIAAVFSLAAMIASVAFSTIAASVL